MKKWTLDTIIGRFDNVVKLVDFNHLPERESEEYRQILFQTANKEIFHEGRYSTVTEWILEIFDIEEVRNVISNLGEINALSPEKRQRLSFYMDLKELCYPLFRGQKIDWTAWPWQMKQESSSMDNADLFDFITSGTYPCLACAILYNVKLHVWNADEEFYSTVAKQELADNFNYEIQHKWNKPNKKEEDINVLSAKINEYANKMWFIENHIYVGRQLGFDLLTQSIYDAFDTYIDRIYRHNQVDCARELAQWIRDNWTFDLPHPDMDKVKELLKTMNALMDLHQVKSPNLNYTWNIIALDILNIDVQAEDDKDEEEEEDMEGWEEEEDTEGWEEEEDME